MDRELLSCLSLFDHRIDVRDFEGEAPAFPFLFHDDEAIAKANEVRAWCSSHGARILFPFHPDYPTQFLDLERPPLFLSVIGEPIWKRASILAVVGSREPAPRALEWMDVHLPRLLRMRSIVTVSGGARGIDQKAHAVSMRCGQPTIAFLPAGLANVYPSSFQSWLPEIVAQGGAIVSEFAPHAPMRKRNFEQRNRLIAAVSSLLFVVEARRRSGSLMTARLAQEMGVPKCVLPSFPADAGSAGTLDLLFDGAFPIRDAEDLFILFELAAASIPSAAEAPNCRD